MNKTTVYLPDELQTALDGLARRTSRSKADLIREAVASFVEHQERPWPSFIGMGKHGDENGSTSVDGRERPRPVSRGIFDDEDEVNSTNVDEWLRANWQPD